MLVALGLEKVDADVQGAVPYTGKNWFPLHAQARPRLPRRSVHEQVDKEHAVVLGWLGLHAIVRTTRKCYRRMGSKTR